MVRPSYSILLTAEQEGGFSVSVPELPGCFTEGETIEEAVDMAKEAIMLYIESFDS
jgi:predicted RNase H-like HicB family nuclease